jgi:phosphoenolpyruvate phosphomutase
LRDLLDAPGEIVVVVDSAPAAGRITGIPDFAYCSAPDDRSLFGQDIDLARVSATEEPSLGMPCGRWIGMLCVRAEGGRWLGEALNELKARPDFGSLNMRDLLNHLVAQGRRVKVLYIHGHWLNVNSLEDVNPAHDFTQGRWT